MNTSKRNQSRPSQLDNTNGYPEISAMRFFLNKNFDVFSHLYDFLSHLRSFQIKAASLVHQISTLKFLQQNESPFRIRLPISPLSSPHPPPSIFQSACSIATLFSKACHFLFYKLKVLFFLCTFFVLHLLYFPSSDLTTFLFLPHSQTTVST